MTVTDDYITLRKLQKRAREEMWHVLSHHEDVAKEWGQEGLLSCLSDLKKLVEWEPEDD